MFSVWIKLNKSIFKRNNKFNNTVTARTWVLSTKRTRPWPSTGLVSEQKNTGSLYLLKWLMLFFRMSRCCIVITEKNITIVLAFDSFSKKCCHYNFSDIFKGRQTIFEPCRNSKCPIRWLLQWRKTLPGTIWETRQV